MEKLFIVGFGPGDEALLSARAKTVIESADRVLSTARISQSDRRIQNCKLSELLELLRGPVKGVTAVLVSGDCCFFSLSKRITAEFDSFYDIELVNGISSIQYLSAKLAVAYEDGQMVSMHGRDGRVLPKVCYNKKVFVLTGGAFKAQDICGLLDESGLGGVRVVVGERLSYPGERILKGTARELSEQNFEDLSVMYIENPEARDPSGVLFDKDFIRGDVPMTKEEVRWLSLQKLNVMPDDVVYDIGAGTGSVSVELARKARNGFVYAIEAKAEACALVAENRKKHGAYNIKILEAKAPEAIPGLPGAQKVFIGGSSGNMEDIVKCLADKNPGVRITANAVTLQGIGRILSGFEAHGLTGIDTVCVNIAKSRRVGAYDLMTARNPVYIVTGQVRA